MVLELLKVFISCVCVDEELYVFSSSAFSFFAASSEVLSSSGLFTLADSFLLSADVLEEGCLPLSLLQVML